MDKADLAYVAGLFDGDGCVYIHKNKPNRKHGNVNPEYKVAVQIANTSQPVLRELQKVFGGHLGRTATPREDNHTQGFYWGTYSRKAISFLNLVIPFLRIKKEQAQLALLFQAAKDSIGFTGRRPYTSEEIAIFEQYRLTMREMKGNNAR